ncbi:MAG: Hsp20/alpha crystallin family protein [Candidatus Promineifilaceae bacterium]|jgi:HSP20 family protein
MAIVRWNPTHDMMRLRSEFDRLFDETLELPAWRWPQQTHQLAIDVAEDDAAYIIKASVPGIKADDLDVSIIDNVLTIKGEIKDENELDEENYHLRERRWGSFSRSITLPSAVDADAVEASYEDGVLTLNIPKTEEVKARRIPIKEVQTKVIEAQAATNGHNGKTK